MRLKQYNQAEEYARAALAFPGGSQVFQHPYLIAPRSSARAQASASLSLAVALAANGKIQAAHDVFSSAASASRHATEVYVLPSTPATHTPPRFAVTTSGPTCSLMPANAKLLPGFCSKGRLTTPVGLGVAWGQPSSCVTSDIRKMRFSCAPPPRSLSTIVCALSLFHLRYNEALVIEPSNARAYYSFGNLYLDAGDHARALPLCASTAIACRCKRFSHAFVTEAVTKLPCLLILTSKIIGTTRATLSAHWAILLQQSEVSGRGCSCHRSKCHCCSIWPKSCKTEEKQLNAVRLLNELSRCTASNLNDFC
jgi:hypothetical protein